MNHPVQISVRTVVSFSMFAAAVAMGASSCGSTITVVGGECSFNGESFEAGESFPAGDGCNTCHCQEGGEVSCTTIGCGGGCFVDGVTHAPGASFDAGDGCNTCTCLGEGQVECTKIACNECSGTIECPSPSPECFYDGPYCIDGELTCGELFCDDCSDDPPFCQDPPEPNCWADAVCGEFGWECEISCEKFCEDAFADGYLIALDLVEDHCGCQEQAPCHMVCDNTQSCDGNLNADQCWSCIQQEAKNGNACVSDALFGPECQSEFPECQDYIDCVMQQG